ncbi:Co/Zn/Cd efflux system membrane component [Alcanivorax sp. MD8A]|jgi:Cu(I)/Ag(I) efflux system membrane protein CusA/SilA|nr:Co/Zn/Cd efflux system membrane component [Alcanivorax sp. MD8A]
METLGQFWMAINMGGMLSALVLTLLVLPAVYLLWKQGKVDE